MTYDLQKASLLKRASAFLLDAILLSVLATGVCLLIALAAGYDGHLAVVEEAYARIGAEYGVTPEMQKKLPEELSLEEVSILNAADAAIAKDDAAVYAYNMVITLTLVIITFGLLGAFLLLEFAVPLLLGNGQTLGKKIFGIAVMHTDGVRLGHIALFIRTVLGKFTVETMPLAMSFVYIFSGAGSPVFLLISAVLLIVQIVMLIATKENALLHDRMAVTVAVDLGSQMIFDTREQLLEYKKKLHAEKAATANY